MSTRTCADAEALRGQLDSVIGLLIVELSGIGTLAVLSPAQTDGGSAPRVDVQGPGIDVSAVAGLGVADAQPPRAARRSRPRDRPGRWCRCCRRRRRFRCGAGRPRRSERPGRRRDRRRRCGLIATATRALVPGVASQPVTETTDVTVALSLIGTSLPLVWVQPGGPATVRRYVMVCHMAPRARTWTGVGPRRCRRRGGQGEPRGLARGDGGRVERRRHTAREPVRGEDDLLWVTERGAGRRRRSW